MIRLPYVVPNSKVKNRACTHCRLIKSEEQVLKPIFSGERQRSAIIVVTFIIWKAKRQISLPGILYSYIASYQLSMIPKVGSEGERN